MNILLVNPNRSEQLLEVLVSSAKSKIDTSRVNLIPLRNPVGPMHIDCSFADYQATWSYLRAVLEIVEKEDIDGVVVAGFGNYGMFAIKEMLNIPVLSIAECSQTLACMLGHKYSILTVLKSNIPYQEDIVRLLGFESKCASVRGIDINVGDWSTEEAVYKNLEKEARLLIEQDHAEVIVLGGSRFCIHAEKLQKQLGVVVIDPVLVTVKQIEMMIETGLCHSKIGKFAYPPKPLESYMYMDEN